MTLQEKEQDDNVAETSETSNERMTATELVERLKGEMQHGSTDAPSGLSSAEAIEKSVDGRGSMMTVGLMFGI